MGKSSKSATLNKSAKPYEGFPLTPHPSGRWCKKIRQRLHYFGKIGDPDAALEKFNREWPYLKDGRTPPPVDAGEGCTVQTLCNTFLTSKASRVDSGELAPRSFHEYHAACKLIVKQFGKDRRVDDLRPDDFEAMRTALASRWGMSRLANEITRIRIVFKYASDQELVDRPVRYGTSFERPSLKSLRKVRNESSPRMFTADEVRTILAACDPVLQAMVLLGLNCGFGNTDIATLPRKAVDLDGGWIEFPRPKTEIRRRVPLWKETVAALRRANTGRPKAKDLADDGLMFIARGGRRWVRVQPRKDGEAGGVVGDALSRRFCRLLHQLGINGRSGLGFYTLRHVHETVGGEAKDQVAVDSIMGHVDPSMGAAYRENISDERLKAVTDHVRGWLFPQVNRARSVERRGHTAHSCTKRP